MMRANTMSRSANWDSAYKGKMVQIAVSKRSSKKLADRRAHDLSPTTMFVFYAAVAIGAFSYFAYLNHDRLADMFNGKVAKAQEVSKIVVKK